MRLLASRVHVRGDIHDTRWLVPLPFFQRNIVFTIKPNKHVGKLIHKLLVKRERNYTYS